MQETTKSKRRLARLAVISIWAIVLPSSQCIFSAAAQTVGEATLSRAVASYDQGDYVQAFNKLEAAVQADCKDNALAHYYFGRAALMNRKLKVARAEFEKGYAIDKASGKTGAVGKLCLDALQSIAAEAQKRSEYAQSLQSLTKDGVGIALHDHKIESAIAAGPAAKAGLKAGDQIVSVDSLSTKDLDDQAIAVLLRGDKGTVSRVSAQRNGKDTTYDVVREPLASLAEHNKEAALAKRTQSTSASNKSASIESDKPASGESNKSTSSESDNSASSGAADQEALTNAATFEAIYAKASEPVQLLMRAAALKAVANMQTPELKQELSAKALALYKEALELTNKRIAARPQDGGLYALRAHIYDSSDQYQKAIGDYDFLAQMGLDNPLFFYARARDRDGLKQYREAAEDYLVYARSAEAAGFQDEKKITGFLPLGAAENLFSIDHLSGYVGAASDYLTLSEDDKVIEVCTEALSKSPEEPRLLLQRAEAFSDKKDYAKALADCNIAFDGLQNKYLFGVPIDTEIGAYKLRAKIYRGLGRDKDASMDEQAVEIISGKGEH